RRLRGREAGNEEKRHEQKCHGRAHHAKNRSAHKTPVTPSPDPLVLVLVLVAVGDRDFPIALVAVPRRGVVRLLVGLSLILALLVVDYLRTLAATGKRQCDCRACEGCNDGSHHDLAPPVGGAAGAGAPPGAAGAAGAAPGRP